MAIVIITMGKFVSDSTKEIGIFRAMGVKKGGVFTMFVLQALLYSLVGYCGGVGLGVLANVGLASVVNKWFDQVVVSSISETYNVVNTVESSVFTHVDWSSVGLFTGLLFAVVFIISLIPAMKASSVSPVEAIKGE
jgi:putative ABC transport system permease protein